uniref:Uncharacterized protein n=1 Tax=Glossina brevipalpis TaxID=37001 RepID=A0A1A9WW83_9MUSC
VLNEKKEQRQQLVNDVNERSSLVFLYLQPKSISYPNDVDLSVNIFLEHASCVITKLSDHSDLIIQTRTFESEKPTFSMIIKQDGTDDITSFSDAPIILTAYENRYEENMEENYRDAILQRVIVAQGYLDVLQFFTKKRCKSSVDVFLYPLDPSEYSRTYKMTWDVYSLMPLIKNVQFSNVIYLSFKSLYNIDEQILNNCNNLIAKLSWRSKVPNETNEYEVEFICKYTVFTKTIVGEQNLYYTWESLKNSSSFKSDHSLGIASGLTLSLHQLFDQILCTENVNFGFDSIDMYKDYALVCNSVHRFVLTDRMHIALEKLLICGRYDIIVEVFNEAQPKEILLEGFIDPSIFLYPEVTNCSFAVALRSPFAVTTQVAPEVVRQQRQNIDPKLQENTPFALIRICLKVPITEPAEDLLDVYNVIEMKRDIFNNCWLKMSSKPTCAITLDRKCQYSYKSFDDSILNLVDFITTNNISSVNEDKYFVCKQITNMANCILPLISCDFNIRQPTKTNMEFMLEQKWSNNETYQFYKFIYALELRNYDAAEEYLKILIYNEEQELFIDICKLYLNYIKNKIDKNFEDNIEENLLSALTPFCEISHPKFPVGWMLLYCVYKRHNYRAGMEYARWHYENLIKVSFIEINKMPKTRWEIFNDFKPTLQTEIANYFWKGITFLLNLGLYIFAQWLYEDIADQLPKIERYILEASFRLAIDQVDDFQIVKTFQMDSPQNAAKLNAFVYLVNGNIEYFRNPNGLSWVDNYASILSVRGLENISPLHLGVLRYAYFLLRQKKFEAAIYAFDFADDIPDVIRSVGKAKAFYYLDRLNEAEQQLALCTTYNIYYPSVWEHLALINLRLGKNYEALECWKYARLNPNIGINEDVLMELDKIDPKNIFLYVSP